MRRHRSPRAGLLLGLVCVLAAAPVHALISEPEHIFYGAVTKNGAPLTSGTVTVLIGSDEQAVASYRLGPLVSGQPAYVQRVPLDSVDPQRPGTARTGDPAYFYVDGNLAGTAVIGGRGSAQVVNLDTAFTAATLVIADAAPVTEGNSGTKNASFTVRLSQAAPEAVSASYTTLNGTATSGSDFTAASGTVSISAGQLTATVLVAIGGDTQAELNETFGVRLSSAVNAVITDANGLGTILNDDVPAVSIADASGVEGVSGSSLSFSLTLSGPTTSTANVSWATANGTAEAGSDYTLSSGTVSFSAGVTTRTVSVPVLANTLDHKPKTFLVRLSSPVNTTLGDAEATGTILDISDTVSLLIDDVVVQEGDFGQTVAVFTVSLSLGSGTAVSVGWTTEDGKALQGSDYALTSGTLTLPPNTHSATIRVPVLGDRLREGPEEFWVVLSSPANAFLGDDRGKATISDNETPTVGLLWSAGWIGLAAALLLGTALTRRRAR